MIYECWAAKDGSVITLFPQDTKQRELNTTDNDGESMEHLYDIRADNWDDARRAHYVCQGWEEYQPMDKE